MWDIVTAPKRGSESLTRMASSGQRKEELCVRDITEFNLQGLVTGGIKKEGRPEKFCGQMMGSQ